MKRLRWITLRTWWFGSRVPQRSLHIRTELFWVIAIILWRAIELFQDNSAPIYRARVVTERFNEDKNYPNHHRSYTGDVGPASWEALVSKHWRMTVELPNSISETCRVDAKVDWSMFWPNTFTLVSHLSLLPLILYPRDFSSFGLFPPVETNWSALTLSEI